jgi:T5orf172 domain
MGYDQIFWPNRFMPLKPAEIHFFTRFRAVVVTMARIKGIKRYVSKGKTYCYHRKSNTRILSEFGTPGFMKELAEIEAGTRTIEAIEAGNPVVYFVQAGRDGLIKIGTTTNFEKRFKDLCRFSPTLLFKRGFMPGGIEVEHRLHRHFKAERRYGEWFEPSERLIDYIRKNAYRRLTLLR